jgi:tetratricopeptide (TPR) repeat protein
MLDSANALLELNADVGAQALNNGTPLHLAAKGGHSSTIQALVISGAALDAKDKQGRVALCFAANLGHTEAVRMLLLLGANGHVVDEKDQEPIEYARQGLHAPVEDVLKRWAEAEMHKLQGNTHFKKGEHAEAVESYTQCLSTFPDLIVPLSNRAMAYISLKQWAEAEADCTTCLHHHSKHVKALYRRATARHKQGRGLEAREDLVSLLKIDSQNKQAAKLLEELIKA